MKRTVTVTEENLRHAAAILRSGGVVAFPTETYYGLAVDPWQDAALERLFRIKRRARELPILVLVAGIEQISLLASQIPALYFKLIDCFWPGPLTLVCPAQSALPPRLTGDTGTVGLRYSSHETANRLIAAFGGPVTATSANLSGFPAALTADEVARIFGTAVDLILDDGGATPGGSGSTLVGLRGTSLYCIREGMIPFAAVQTCAAADPINDKNKNPEICMVDLQWNKAFALEQTAGDEELLEELLVLFKDASTSDLEQLRQAVIHDDAAGVMRAAHSLKGAAASLGIEGIRQLALEMETDGRNGSVAVAKEKLTAMGELLDQLKNL